MKTIMRFRVNHKLALWCWGVFFVLLFARMIHMNYSGLYVGHENVWSDWALHIGMATIFSEKPVDQWFASHPMFADGALTYPFLTNLISGMLMRVGFSIPEAFIIPSVIFSVLLIWGLYRFYCLVTGSEKLATLSLSLFFLAAGMGFVPFFKEWIKDPTLAELLLPPKDFFRQDSYDWFANNFLVGHLVPQRAFLIGMTISAWVMTGFFSYVLSDPNRAERPDSCRRRLILAGLGAGILPIAHMHSFIAMVLLTGPVCILLYRQWRDLAYYVVPAGLLSTSLYLAFVHGGIQNPEFMSWQPGLSAKGPFDWLGFWFRAWGFTFVTAIAGLILVFKSRRKELKIHFSSFFFLFALANLVQFQPIRWDNSKLTVWVYLGFAGLSAIALSWLWAKSRLATAALFVLLTLSGALELLNLQRINQHTLQILNREELQIADRIRAETEPMARFLTNTSHNHPVMVRGARPILLGYVAWAWNFGFLYRQTEDDVHKMFRGGDEAKRLLKHHRVSYVFVGPGERYSMQANEGWYRANFPIRFEVGQNLVFDVRSIQE